MEVFLDTNFILACMESRVDARLQIEKREPALTFLVIGRVLEEIAALPFREKRMAEAFLRGTPHQVVPSKGPTDRDLLEYARIRHASVATLDGALKRRLKKAKIQSISLSNRRVVFL